ncbi:protease inhibitor I42 family protein [Streptomyces cinnamoneus]|uniref:protease inhibitor I42 family protein n=1 Tax=Streptomyces cinnamoneus TaxID=53446 RepID=UPI0037A02E1A
MTRVKTKTSRALARTVGLAVLVSLAAGCGGGAEESPLGTVHQDRPPVYEPGRPKPVDRVEGPLEVRRGERFSIAMRQNASTRTEWNVSGSGPDRAVVRPKGTSSHQTAEEREAVGAGYTKYFTFEAAGPGTTTIVLANRCGTDPSLGCYAAGLPHTVTYRVSVR